MNDDNRFKFFFVGQGSQKEKIIKYIENNKLDNCICIDFLEKDKYDALLEEVSLTILSLKKEMTGLGSPSKFYGYLAVKKPVVAIMSETTDVVKI